MGKAKKIIYTAMFLLFAAVFIVSAVVVGKYFVESAERNSQYGDLSDQVDDIRNSNTEPTATVTAPFTEPESQEPGTILPEYAGLFLQNTDMVGWIRIEGTKVNYPVLQRPDQVDYYLKKGFDKNYNAGGAIYVREVCDVNTPSDNVTIYGHNMHDGSMFATITRYQYQDFWEEHRFIEFDTLTQRHTYEVICAFKTTGYADEGFAYHLFVNADSEGEFDRFISTCKRLDFFETGVTAEYGDKLICLSTCEYTQDNGRFVVVAKRVS